jgi:hypothetical protein
LWPVVEADETERPTGTARAATLATGAAAMTSPFFACDDPLSLGVWFACGQSICAQLVMLLADRVDHGCRFCVAHPNEGIGALGQTVCLRHGLEAILALEARWATVPEKPEPTR